MPWLLVHNETCHHIISFIRFHHQQVRSLSVVSGGNHFKLIFACHCTFHYVIVQLVMHFQIVTFLLLHSIASFNILKCEQNFPIFFSLSKFGSRPQDSILKSLELLVINLKPKSFITFADFLIWTFWDRLVRYKRDRCFFFFLLLVLFVSGRKTHLNK